MKLFSILAVSFFAAIGAAQSDDTFYAEASVAAGKSKGKLLNYTEATNAGATFPVKRTAVSWTDADQDGTYVTVDPATSSLLFVNIVTGEKETFVDASKLGFEYDDYAIQPSRENVLFATGYIKQYRYSFFADYYVFNRATGSVTPLFEGQKQDIQYAGWSTKGDVIAFVRANNLYLWKNGEVQQITQDGGPDVFNGVPDWVYEEEIFGDTKTLWFSADGEYVAYLSFNETGVETYTVPYYMASGTNAPSYPKELDIRYPKVGTKNPTVTVNLLKVETGDITNIPVTTYEPENLVITEVAWVSDNHENFLFRTMNRVQDTEKVVVVDTATLTSTVVRERDGTDGWLDAELAVQYLPGTGTYVDLSDVSGWKHIYIHSVKGGEPKALTSGKWEVTAIAKVDAKRGYIYYLSTERHSTERHLYRVDIKTGIKTALVDDKSAGYWGASFSADGGYYIASYNGPDVPYQKLYSVNSTTPLQTLNDNAALKTKLAEYKLPKTNYYEIKGPHGLAMNVREILPANFDSRKKYPVLFDPYGGPGAQDVTKAFVAPNWRYYIASDPELEYILVKLDNRGTGNRGRAFRAIVAKNLGAAEAEDQVWLAKEYAKKRHVDSEHIAIWGWSYGGYLSSKVIELDSGAFSLGLITAPVSDWKFYDTLYTERYMKTPELNPAGYNVSGVTNVAGFKNIKGGVLIQHGTGDDNVHFQHSAVLSDILMREKVSPEKLRSQWFTDSDHSINFHNNGVFLYKQLTARLYEEKNRGRKVQSHQWSKRTVLDKRRPQGWWTEAQDNTKEKRTEGEEGKGFIVKRDPVGEVAGTMIGRGTGFSSGSVARRRVERRSEMESWSGEGISEASKGGFLGAGWKSGVIA